MKRYLPKGMVKVIKIGIILLLIFPIKLNFDGEEIISNDLNSDKNISFKHYYIDYGVKIEKDSSLPFLKEYTKVEGEEGLKVSSGEEEEAIVVKEPIEEIIAIGTANPVLFEGEMTGYGPDCKNCLGIVSCAPYPNVQNGNIYYNDEAFGSTRIIAADRNVPCGTIVEISDFTNNKALPDEETILAIVLDRGSAIKGNIIDLLFASEKEAWPVGRQDVNIEVKRWGW